MLWLLSMPRRVPLIAAALLLCLSALPSASNAQDANSSGSNSARIARLEQQFYESKDLVLVRLVSDLPEDVAQKLRAQVGTRIADWGERWMMGDVDDLVTPIAQHVFSGISDTFAAILYQKGGIRGVHVYLLITSRAAPDYCVYDLGDRIPAVLDYLRSPFYRDPRGPIPGKPTCVYKYL